MSGSRIGGFGTWWKSNNHIPLIRYVMAGAINCFEIAVSI
jgi:hypothetical protein